MIITKTPLRVSFAGGGTDLPAFYEQEEGIVISSSVSLSIYIAAHKVFDDRILLKYSEAEDVKRVSEIKHPLFRECMKHLDFNSPVEISAFADIPSKGSGLGSSSSFTVGLLKALSAFQWQNIGAEDCADGACEVEIGRLAEPIGKQDQYAAAYGGLNAIRFSPDGSVKVNPIILEKEKRRKLNDSLIMFYTGITRSASGILQEQQQNTISSNEKFKGLQIMKGLALELEEHLNKQKIEVVGEMMHAGWLEKKKLATKISNPQIDDWYAKALSAGALGGKLLGAGGGGFMMFYCEKEKQHELSEALSDMRKVDFDITNRGTQILYSE